MHRIHTWSALEPNNWTLHSTSQCLVFIECSNKTYVFFFIYAAFSSYLYVPQKLLDYHYCCLYMLNHLNTVGCPSVEVVIPGWWHHPSINIFQPAIWVAEQALDHIYWWWNGVSPPFPYQHRLSWALPSSWRPVAKASLHTERGIDIAPPSPETGSDKDFITYGSGSLLTWPLAARKSAVQTHLCLIGCTGGQRRDLGSNRSQISP